MDPRRRLAGDPQDGLRGPTPRPSTEYGTRPTTPAEESSVEAIVARVVGQILGERTAADESTITARVHDDLRGKTRRYRTAIGGLGAALVALASWSISQVEAYGQSRADAATSALKAESKAQEAARYLEETRHLAAEARQVSEATSARVDQLDAKLDRLLRIAESEAK